MTLREELQKIKVNVKIGAKVGYFYCGLTDDISNIIKEISDKFRAEYNRRLVDVKRYLDNFEKIWDSELRRRGSEVINQHRDTPELMAIIRKEWEADKKEAYEEALNRKKYLTNYVKNWKDLLDRDVKEKYSSIDVSEPIGTTILIVEGDEKGQYWMTKEYNNANK